MTRTAAFLGTALAVLGLFSGAALAQAPAACDRPHAAGTSTRIVEVGGREREYLLVVPDGYDGATRLPVVLTYHGSGSTPERQLEISGLGAAAQQRGLVVAAPRAARPMPAGGVTWNVPPLPEVPDDVAFAAAIVDDLDAALCIDTARVYASGFSGGARLSSTLACELGERVAAIGAVGGLRHPDGCAPGRAVPVIAFHGTADGVNPYEGGGPDYWGEPVDAAFAGWGRAHGAGTPLEHAVSAGVTRIEYTGAEGRADAVLYRLDGAGHVWPGSADEFSSERLGPDSDVVDATALMLDFFAERSLP